MLVNDIRKEFIKFFEQNGHTHVASSPLVPQNDPTLMFVNSGMVQFKNVFIGQEQRDYKTATSAQKCVRAGGKHNDLENVGYTARHHTFFEMLGNFSFGDYFKDVAIDLAWRMITQELGLPKDKLLVTVYHDDDDAAKYWKQVAGLSDDRIIRIKTNDNFWQMGPVGPCGPCSEIFYDHGDHIPGGPPGSPDEDGDRFIEIWNLVFMQYEQHPDDTRTNLPKPSIDTGMGLERIAAILQGKHNNYQIDTMQNLILALSDIAKSDPQGDLAASHKVVADHLRASAFLIADGIFPANEGRGYVLRRIMRRGMRHLHMLGLSEPTMHKLVPTLVHEMGGHYTELQRAQSAIADTMFQEEERFIKTLSRGLSVLAKSIDGLPAQAPLPGEVAFKLYDTYGFPLDLTADILRNQQRQIAMPEFDKAMSEQKARARKAWKGSGEQAQDAIWFGVSDAIGHTEFLGYQNSKAEGILRAIIFDGKRVDTLQSGQEAILLFNQTPFYGESGGQQGDQGTITFDNDIIFDVTDTQKMLGHLIVHYGKLQGGDIAIDDTAHLVVDTNRRNGLCANHSATHLLHNALRTRLGAHVHQKGSLVAPDNFRFDFSHPKPLDDSDIAAVEDMVNSHIRGNSETTTRIMNLEDAQNAGALALFGEKYDDEVRVVAMGGAQDVVELCGGTHAKRMGDIGSFQILRESGVAAGIRRIEAVTGESAQKIGRENANILARIAHQLKSKPDQLEARIAQLQQDLKDSERKFAQAKRNQSLDTGTTKNVEAIGTIKFTTRILQDQPANELKSIAEQALKQDEADICAILSVSDGKTAIVITTKTELSATYDAVTLIRQAAVAMGGKGGGGRADMAQAGAPSTDKTDQALNSLRSAIAQIQAT